MCGILFSSIESMSKLEFMKSLKLIEHRGPDAPLCFYQHNRFMLGHNRLSILDLNERSNQPFFSEDGHYAIIFNGEIYNYRELASQHRIKMSTSSDTELLLKLYLRYGPKMLTWLNGMFSFIILDLQNDDFFIARDRLGIKPLYYYKKDDGYVLGSEISSLLPLDNNNILLDEIAIRQYKKMRCFFNGRTIYSNIKEFPPGYYMKNGKFYKYWSIDYSDKEPPTDEELDYLLRSAVDLRKVSDVEIGSFLSGGLDSTIVTTLANVDHTWTVGFKSFNEFEWSRTASHKIGSTHHEIIMEPEQFEKIAIDLIKKKGEPLSVPNEVLLYHMTRSVKAQNKVIMTGEGADELFFGYDRIFRWASNEKQWDLKGFSRHYSYGSDNEFDIVEDVINPYLDLKTPLKIVAAFFQEAHLRGLLKRLDSATMLNSVEARSPFLDYRLIERLAGVGIDYKMQNGIVKAPLKRVFQKQIPTSIIKREKMGFPVPLQEVISNKIEGETFFDKWFNFNLINLGVMP